MSAWVVSSSLVSPLGFTSEENYAMVRQEISGLSEINDTSLSSNPIFAGRVHSLSSSSTQTKLEVMCGKAVSIALKNIALDPDRTLYILSTTKGNIELLNAGNYDPVKIHLHTTAKQLADDAGFQHSVCNLNRCC